MDTEQTRKHFEEWAKQEHMDTLHDREYDDLYLDPSTHAAWLGWQAATARAEAAAALIVDSYAAKIREDVGGQNLNKAGDHGR